MIVEDVILILFKFEDAVCFDIFYLLLSRTSRRESTPRRNIPSPPNRSSSQRETLCSAIRVWVWIGTRVGAL
jgi:hypothetical protein